MAKLVTRLARSRTRLVKARARSLTIKGDDFYGHIKSLTKVKSSRVKEEKQTRNWSKLDLEFVLCKLHPQNC